MFTSLPSLKTKKDKIKQTKNEREKNTHPIFRRRQESLTLKVLGKKSPNTDLWI